MPRAARRERNDPKKYLNPQEMGAITSNYQKTPSFGQLASFIDIRQQSIIGPTISVPRTSVFPQGARAASRMCPTHPIIKRSNRTVSVNRIMPMLPIRKNQMSHMLLCDHYTADAAGKPSFIGVFQTITLPNLPAAIPRFYLVVAVANVSAAHVEIALLLPDGASHTLISNDLPPVESKLQDFNFAIEFANLPFTQAGRHKFSIKCDDRTLGSVDLNIILGDESNANKQSK